MIKTDVFGLRDPFILVDNGVYYLYGTVIDGNWDSGTSYGCYKNESGRLDGEWVKLPPVAVMPCHATKNRWAPEVHKYNGAYYMLATYFSENTGKRGCAVFKADSPEGPFKEISNGQITPREWDAIDGTLYVDKHGQPWMIFVHEWISTDDNIGRMDVAKLTDDLSAFASDTKEIFRADSPAWARDRITDGCFMYDTADGQLVMIWSNFDDDGYCIGTARSRNGEVDGEWVQDEDLLYSKSIGGKDGGHGMIFNDLDGNLMLALHSPNTPEGDEKERVIVIPLTEENGDLKCVLDK